MISVILATYRQAEVLPWILTSLERQDFRDGYEVLVCDDGSDADALAALEKWRRTSGLDVRYLWQPDQGFRLGRSRNNGIRCARGDLLVFIDGDVIVPPTFLSRHAEIHAKHAPGPAVVGGTRRWVNIDTRQQGLDFEQLYRQCLAGGYERDRIIQGRLFQGALPWTACWGFNMSLPRRPEILYDERIIGWGNEDLDLSCSLCERLGYATILDAENIVYHLATPGAAPWNPWQTRDPEQIGQYVRNLLYVKDKYPEVNLTPACWLLTLFTVDEQGVWRMAPPGAASTITQSLRMAQAWAKGKEGLA